MGSRTRREPTETGNTTPVTESPAPQSQHSLEPQESQESLSELRDQMVAPEEESPGLSGVLSEAEEELAVDEYDVTQDMHVSAAEGGEKVTLAEGTRQTLTADQVGTDGWRTVARSLGTTADKLAAFNEGIIPAEGAQIYVPSAEERLFAEYRAHYGFDEAVTEFYAAKEGPSVAVYTAASDRASGTVGESYGTQGVDGRFYTPNADVAGASSRRSEEINGQTEYKVFWIADFWKCSIFMNDAVFQGGYEPAIMANNHYSVAGRAHQQTTVYEEVDVADARPGDAWQRFGGTASNESHNAILSSFVEVSEDPYSEEVDVWKFKIIGAETERAAEGEKTKRMNAGTNETTDGKIIRFLRPINQRSETG